MGAETLTARPSTVNDLPKDHSAGRYVEDARALIAGNAVKLLRNGSQAFPAWLAAIDGAQTRVSMEMYIFSDDIIGRRFADALARAARRGVVVRLMYDYVGCRFTSAEFFQNLRDAGVRTSVYHGYRGWRPRVWSLFRRNHRKTLVVDGTVAFTGGLNISQEWLPPSEGGDDWRDAAIQIQGPAVSTIEEEFGKTWNRRSDKSHRLLAETTARKAGPTGIAVLTNSERGGRFTIRRASLHAMHESHQRIMIANPYFAPDGGILRTLRHAARRGIDVRILLPEESDSLVLDAAARATFSRLLKAGVRIWLGRAVIHTKVVLVDDAFVSIGSYNFDHRSLAYNLEMVANVIDSAFNADTALMLNSEIEQAHEVDRETFESRPLSARPLEWLAHALRRWL
jgi:cardiolipin synthase